jgi:hypothetical protein
MPTSVCLSIQDLVEKGLWLKVVTVNDHKKSPSIGLKSDPQLISSPSHLLVNKVSLLILHLI